LTYDLNRPKIIEELAGNKGVFMRITLKVAIVFLFFSLLIIRPTSSYAYWHHHDHGYVGVNIGLWPGSYYYGGPYYPYYSDPYYPGYPAYPGYAVVASSSYQPVVVNGVTYYVNNGVYYIYTQYGYQAVATPAGASVPVVQALPAVSTVQAPTVIAPPGTVDTDDTFTINIPNDKGGYTAIILKKTAKGFIGPQGELYPDFPKVSQLQVIYGK
jgi:hypothetical protein